MEKRNPAALCYHRYQLPLPTQSSSRSLVVHPCASTAPHSAAQAAPPSIRSLPLPRRWAHAPVADAEGAGGPQRYGYDGLAAGQLALVIRMWADVVPAIYIPAGRVGGGSSGGEACGETNRWASAGCAGGKGASLPDSWTGSG